MVEIDIFAKDQDVRDFNDAMSKLVERAAKTPHQAVTWGGIKLLDSLGRATKVSKPQREVYLPKTKKQKAMRTDDGRSLFYVKVYRSDGSFGLIPKWGHNREQIRRHFPIAQIRNAGLAKMSWGWARKKLFNRPYAGKANLGTGVMDGAIDTQQISLPGFASVRVTNKLKYIHKAFRKNGRYTVNNSVRRAADGMMYQVQEMIFKKERRRKA